MTTKKLRVTVEGRAYDVVVEFLGEGSSASTPTQASPQASIPSAPQGGTAVPSPLAGKVMSIDVKDGEAVQEGQQLMVLEAMKMNTFVYAPQPGTVSGIAIAAGDHVEEGQKLLLLN